VNHLNHRRFNMFGALGHPNGDNPSGNFPTCTSSTNICPAGAPGCPIMTGQGGAAYSAHMMGLDDIEGLRALYGARDSSELRAFDVVEVWNGNYWWAETVADEPSPSVGGHIDASSWPYAARSAVSLSGRYRNSGTLHGALPFAWDWWDGSTDYVGTLFGYPVTGSSGRVGVVETSTLRVTAQHFARMSNDSRRYRRRLSRTSSLLSGGSWATSTTDPSIGALDDTLTAGVSTAFHSPSGATLYAVRGDTGNVILRGQSGTTWSQPINTGTSSYSQPAIECAGTSCLLVVVESPRPIGTASTSRLQWREFTWSQTGGVASATFGALNTTIYNVWGDPSMAVVERSDGGYEYVILVTMAYDLGAGDFGTTVIPFRHTAGGSNFTSNFDATMTFEFMRPFVAAGGFDRYATAHVLTP